jgi:hypothetical protein
MGEESSNFRIADHPAATLSTVADLQGTKAGLDYSASGAARFAVIWPHIAGNPLSPAGSARFKVGPKTGSYESIKSAQNEEIPAVLKAVGLETFCMAQRAQVEIV